MIESTVRPEKLIELYEPIEHGGQRYDAILLHEPTAEQVERAESELANGVNVQSIRRYQIALVSHGAGVPTQVVRKMAISQLREAFDFLSVFVGGGPPTGET